MSDGPHRACSGSSSADVRGVAKERAFALVSQGDTTSCERIVAGCAGRPLRSTASSKSPFPPRARGGLALVASALLSLSPPPPATLQTRKRRSHTSQPTRHRLLPSVMLSSLAPSGVHELLPTSAAGAWRLLLTTHADLPEPLRFLPSAFRLLALSLFVPVAALAVVSPPLISSLVVTGEVRHELQVARMGALAGRDGLWDSRSGNALADKLASGANGLAGRRRRVPRLHLRSPPPGLRLDVRPLSSLAISPPWCTRGARRSGRCLRQSSIRARAGSPRAAVLRVLSLTPAPSSLPQSPLQGPGEGWSSHRHSRARLDSLALVDGRRRPPLVRRVRLVRRL